MRGKKAVARKAKCDDVAHILCCHGDSFNNCRHFRTRSAGCSPPSRPLVDYSVAIQSIEKGEVNSAIFSGSRVMLILKAGGSLHTALPPTDPMIDRLLVKVTPIKVVLEDNTLTALMVLISWLPLAVFIWAMWFFIGRPVSRMTARIEALLQLQK